MRSVSPEKEKALLQRTTELFQFDFFNSNESRLSLPTQPILCLNLSEHLKGDRPRSLKDDLQESLLSRFRPQL